MNNNQFWIRVMGLSGILGGLVLFAGDMFLYYDPINTNLYQNMGNASDSRIIASGFTALIATWLYLIGIGQVYHAFKPSRALLRNTVIVCFGCILTSYGIIHGAYTAIATSAILSIEHNLDINSAVSLASNVNNKMRLIIYPIFAVLSVIFIHQV